jgi:hypothetical protein
VGCLSAGMTPGASRGLAGCDRDPLHPAALRPGEAGAVPADDLWHRRRSKTAATNDSPQPTVHRTVVKRYGSRGRLPVSGRDPMRMTSDECGVRSGGVVVRGRAHGVECACDGNGGGESLAAGPARASRNARGSAGRRRYHLQRQPTAPGQPGPRRCARRRARASGRVPASASDRADSPRTARGWALRHGRWTGRGACLSARRAAAFIQSSGRPVAGLGVAVTRKREPGRLSST